MVMTKNKATMIMGKSGYPNALSLITHKPNYLFPAVGLQKSSWVLHGRQYLRTYFLLHTFFLITFSITMV